MKRLGLQSLKEPELLILHQTLYERSFSLLMVRKVTKYLLSCVLLNEMWL